MYDKNFLVSFSERTLHNYNNYLKDKKNEKYDATLLICSFAGILSILDDNARKEIFEDIDLPCYICPEKNYYIDSRKDNNKENLAILRHMRNALCHFKLDAEHILPDKDNNIKEIVFEDFYLGSRCFKCKLNINELQETFYFIIKTIQSTNR